VLGNYVEADKWHFRWRTVELKLQNRNPYKHISILIEDW